jgi:acid phosphatase class B
VKSFEDYKGDQSKPVISFDFDDTIYKLTWDDEENDYVRDEQNQIIGELDQEISDLIYKYHKAGKKVVVVTSRMDATMDEVREFIKKHNLPIQEIHNTNFEPKVFTLEKIGASVHYDDDIEEIRPLKSRGIEGVHIDRYGEV